MVKINKSVFVLFAVLIAAVIFSGLGFIVSNTLGNYPYFVKQGMGVGEVGLKLYVFQPVFITAYDKDGGVFARVVYIYKGMPKFMDLWLSGRMGNTELMPVSFLHNKEKVSVARAQDLNSRIYPGTRIRVEYVSGEPGSGDGFVSDNNVCKHAPRICQVYEIVSENSNTFSKFNTEGSLPDNLKLPILYLGGELEK